MIDDSRRIAILETQLNELARIVENLAIIVNRNLRGQVDDLATIVNDLRSQIDGFDVVVIPSRPLWSEPIVGVIEVVGVRDDCDAVCTQ